jgi:hypothetical protein
VAGPVNEYTSSAREGRTSPLNSTQLYIKGLVDGLILPGNNRPLEAFITPEDPRDEPNPAIYIWPARGDEHRQASPRVNVLRTPNSAGWKIIDHEIELFLMWFDDDGDAQSDTTFPAVIDTVMFTLRSNANPAVIYDPYTALGSQLIDVGERMTYQLAGVRAVADQRFLRYDALITLSITEELQS